MLALLLAVVALCVALIVTGATMAPPDDAPITTATQTLGIALLVAGIVAVCVAPVLLLMGFFTIQPNQARVLILFGDYKGTVRDRALASRSPATPSRSTCGGQPITQVRRSRCAPVQRRAPQGERQVRQPHRDRRRHRVARREHGESAGGGVGDYNTVHLRKARRRSTSCNSLHVRL